MKKKILIGLVVVVVFIGAGMTYLNYRNRTMSPPGNAALTNGDLKVSISYSRPSVRGRLIFGTKEEGALQPYGEYWRLGANESTEITFNKDVLFNNQPLKAGTYRLYAFPGADEFEIAVNSELGTWGAFRPDFSFDVLRTKLPVENTPAKVEVYTVQIVPAETGADVIFEWDETRFVLPLRLQ